MSDKEVAEKMASLFIELGGDVDGFAFMYSKIKEEIEKQLAIKECE